MTRSLQFSEWDMSGIQSDSGKSTTQFCNFHIDKKEEKEESYRRRAGAFLKCCECCPCSKAVLFGLLIGSLVAGIALGVVIPLYVTEGKTTVRLGAQTTVTTSTVTTATTTSSTSATTTTATTSTSSSTSSTSTSTTSRTTSTSSTSTTSVTSTTSTSTSTSSTTSTSSVSTTSTSSITTATTTTTSSATTSTATTATTTTTTTTTTTAPYCLTRVTFDDIPGQVNSGVVPNGYYNFNWTNTEYINATSMPPGGYINGVNSPPYVAHSPSGASMSFTSANGTRFKFDSIVLTAAWRMALNCTMLGYRGVSLVFRYSFLLQPINQTTLSCSGCSQWNQITLQTAGGEPYNGLADNTTHLVMDDLCVSFGY